MTMLCADAAPAGLLDILLSGGITGIGILLVLLTLSLLAFALVVEHLLAFQRTQLAPPGLMEQVQKALQQGDLEAARRASQASPSLQASVILAALDEADQGWAAVEKALEATAAEQAARYFRKIEYLSVIGNIAPMIGLLGTVIGMIFAFQEVANTQGAARAAQLAGGIYQALVTTVGGLILAIPSLTAYAVLRDRVDGMITEIALSTHRGLRRLKRTRPAS